MIQLRARISRFAAALVGIEPTPARGLPPPGVAVLARAFQGYAGPDLRPRIFEQRLLPGPWAHRSYEREESRRAAARWGAVVGALLVLLSGCIPPSWPPQGQGPTPTAIPTPAPTRTPQPVQTFQAAEGRAVLELDLGGFELGANGLDYYAAATLLWEQPPATRDNPRTPALELSIRGTSPELCQRAPCGASTLGLVARWSSNVAHDGETLEEREHCGEGINYSRRLPLGPGPRVPVSVEWRAGQVQVSTPLASWTTSKGANGPGFALLYLPLPRDRGIGWSREPWTLQRHGGAARLISWTGTGGTVGACP